MFVVDRARQIECVGVGVLEVKGGGGAGGGGKDREDGREGERWKERKEGVGRNVKARDREVGKGDKEERERG